MVSQTIASCHEALSVYQPREFPIEARKTAQFLGNFCFDRQLWPEAIEAYMHALAAADVLYQSSLLPSNREIELADVGDLYHRAAYAYAKNSRYQEAVVTLESGLAKSLGESLSKDQANLTRLRMSNPRVYSRYKEALIYLRETEAADRRFIGEGKGTRELLTQNAKSALEAFEAIVQLIRGQPGFADFLDQIAWNDIALLVSDDEPLIYVSSTSAGGLCLIVQKPSEEKRCVYSSFLHRVFN